jgi:hypothetical protein
MAKRSESKASANDALIVTGPPVETDDPAGYLKANKQAQAASDVERMERKVAKAEASGDAADVQTAKAALAEAVKRQKELK